MPAGTSAPGWSDRIALVSAPGMAAIRAAAARGGALLVDLVSTGCPPDALPGSPDGPFLAPAADDARALSIATDAEGRFLTRTIDLVLRAHQAKVIAVAANVPREIVAALTHFCAERNYALCRAEDIANAPAEAAPPAPPPLLGTLGARIAPGTAALVLIDVQNDFCGTDGATARSGQPMTMIAAAVRRIRELLEAARRAGLFIVHVRAEYGALYRNVGSPYRFPTQGGREPAVWTASAADLGDAKRFPPDVVEVCLPGTPGADFVDGFAPRPGEAVVTKHRFGAFTETGLEPLLRGRGIQTVILAGVTTNCCVETTARQAVMHDFYLVVASDCVAVKDHLADLHHATLESLGLYFGLVRPSTELMAAWAEIPAPRARVPAGA